MNAKLMLILGTALQCNMQFNIKACQSLSESGKFWSPTVEYLIKALPLLSTNATIFLTVMFLK